MRSSIIGSGLSNSMYSKRASIDFDFVAARVEERPFSTRGVMVRFRVLSSHCS